MPAPTGTLPVRPITLTHGVTGGFAGRRFPEPSLMPPRAWRQTTCLLKTF